MISLAERCRRQHLPYVVGLSSVILGLTFFAAPFSVRASNFQVDTNGTLTTNLVSYYRMEGSSADDWGTVNGSDSSGISYATSTGKLGEGAYMGSTSTDSINLGNHDGAIFTGDFSVAAWIYWTGTQNVQIISKTDTAQVAAPMALSIATVNGKGTLLLYLGPGGSQSHWISSFVVPTSTWTQVVVTRSNASNTVNFYMNDQLNSTSTQSGSATSSDTTNNALIGNDNGNEHFTGDIDELGIWSKVLSNQEVQDLYNGGSGDSFNNVGSPYIASSSLQQYRSDATTTIPVGGTTTETSVVFGGTLESGSTSTVRLDVEVVTSTSNFLGQATVSSPFISGGFATTSISNLSPGNYYWRARAYVNAQTSSTWQDFAASGTIDFIVSTRLSFPFQVDTSATLTTSLDSYYSLEGNSNDSWGPVNGTDSSGISYGTSTGYVNQGAYMGGSNTDNINLGNNDGSIFTGDFSIASWVKITNGGDGQIISKTNNAEFAKPMAWYIDSGKPTLYLGSDGTSQAHWQSATTLTNGTWYHLAVTRTGDTVKIYINGASSTPSKSGTQNPSDGTDNALIGNDNGGEHLSGDVDELGIWSKVLSDQEIKDLASADPFSGLKQYRSDAITAIPRGATTTENSVVFGSTLYPVGSSTLKLQVEVTTSTSFTGTPNASSSDISTSGTFATTTFINSSAINSSVYPSDPESWSNGKFHWQARVIDGNGATSTWQTYGTTTSAADFRVQTAPLYTQEASNYPSFASSSVWASSTYDNALPGTQCGTGANSSTIEACGCAITSVAMWLRYFGIATDTRGNDVNPLNLNAWLASSTGYDVIGNLKWDKVTGYASTTNGGAIYYDANSPSYTSNVRSLYVDPNLSSSTPDPVILFEDNVPDGNSTTTHFVLATGFARNAATSTYAIRDSFWYNTRYLNQATSSATASTIKGYRNEIDGVRLYYDPPQPVLWGEYHVNAPNALILIDSQGRRTGKDPVTGTLYHEIPNTGYDEIADNPGHRSGELFTSDLPNGKYTLYVLGGQTGAYWLDASHYGQPDQTFGGNIQAGSMIAYLQNYDLAHIASSTFSYQISYSSTASITSAPPNNLPPPVSR